MDKISVARTAQARLAHLGLADSGWFLPNIVNQVQAAMQTVASMLAKTEERHALARGFSVTLVASGDTSSGSLLAAIQASEPIILAPPFISVRAVSGKEFEWCEKREKFDSGDTSLVALYYVQGQTLLARQPSPPTSLTVTANYVPTPENFPNQFYDNVVDAVVEIMMRSLVKNVA